MSYPKKRLVFLLAALFILAACGCENVGDKDLYVIEQLQFNADKLKEEKLGIKPELLTDSDYDEIQDALMAVVKTFEMNYSDLNSKDTLTDNERRASYLAGKSLMDVAMIHDLRGQPDKSLAVLEGFADKFPRNRDQKALALLQVGRKHEKAGNPEGAEQAWLRLLEEYYPPADVRFRPKTGILELPVKLAKLFNDLEDYEKSEKHLDYAEEYYRGIIDEFKYSPLGLTTTRFLADTYVMRNKPTEAIELLEAVKDSTGAILGTAKMLIADIYLTSLGDTVKARTMSEAVTGSEKDSLSQPNAYMLLARLEFMHKNFVECRKHLAVLKSKFERYGSLQAQVQQILAQSFDAEGDFNRAFSEYQWLLTNFPQTEEAIMTLSYLPGFLRNNDQPELAEEWESNAVDQLSEMREARKGTFIGLSAQSNLINALVVQEKWLEAAAELEQVQADYPRSAAGSNALAKAGNIYMDKLNDNEKARARFEQQLNLYPDMPISEEAGARLEELDNLNK